MAIDEHIGGFSYETCYNLYPVLTLTWVCSDHQNIKQPINLWIKNGEDIYIFFNSSF